MPQCNALKNHMCITVSASWRPCCRFNSFPYVNINSVNFENYRKSDFYQDIISDMKDGWASGCKKCEQEENRNHTSLRQVLNKELSGSDDIEYIEISLSNKCNLACKMCSPTYSTTWNKMLISNPELKEYYIAANQPKISVSNIFQSVNLSKIKSIKYLGGEPFITPETKDLFEYLDNAGVIGNITFTCNTNCTFFPSKWLKYLEKFKKVVIELSIDGVGSVNDYIRYGKNWNIVEPIIKKWEHYSKNTNTDLNIFSTVQAYNLHDMKNVKLLAKSINVDHYSSLLVVPDFLSVHVLPNEYLELIKDDYNQKYYKTIENNKKFVEFIKFTKKMDSITNLNIKDVIPTLYSYMENNNESY